MNHHHKRGALVAAFFCALAPHARAVEFGANLAGAEFADYNQLPGTYGVDYRYPNDSPKAPNGSELSYYANKGLKLVRLPFRWERMQHTLFGPLDETEVGRLRSFLAEAQSKGFKVIPDCHNYARFYQTGAPANSRTEYIPGINTDKSALGDLWKKLVPRLTQDYSGTIWGWDIMNEPRNLGALDAKGNRNSEDDAGKQLWFDIAQSTITALRTADTSKPILVAGYQFSPTDRWTQYSDRLKNLNDPSNNLIFEGHTYWDADRSGTYSNGGNLDFQSQTGGDLTRSVAAIGDFTNWLRANHKKGFIGEFSVPSIVGGWQIELSRFTLAVRNNYSDVVVGCTYWAGGPEWNNDTTGAVLDAIHPNGDSNLANWHDKLVMTTYLNAIAGNAYPESGGGGGTPASKDAISSASGPSPVKPGQTVTVHVNYSTTTARKIEASLKNPANGYSYWGGATINVSAGSGAVDISFPIAANTPVGGGYIYTARLNDTGNNLIQEVIQNNVVVANISDGITAVNGPTLVKPGQSITVAVSYGATTSRKLEVALKNPYNNYAWLGGATVNLSAGSGTVNVSFTVDPNAPIGNGFLYTARLNDTSNNLIQEVLQKNISITK